jgi:predicted nucleotidyltransferase
LKVTIYNKDLNPELWTADKILRPEVRSALLKIGKQFFKDTELKVHIRDILFLGSSANYNWTPTSDVDLHLLIDFNDLKMAPDAAKEYTKLISKKWNEEQNIDIRGHNVEVYIQDVQEENKSTGIYSLITNKWIREALPQEIILDRNLIQEKYTMWVQKLNNAISSKNLLQLKTVMKDLVKMRETGLVATGEFSVENLVFKILRQRGIIGKLKDATKLLRSTSLSIKDGFEPTSFGPNAASTEGLPEPGYYQKQLNKMRKMGISQN